MEAVAEVNESRKWEAKKLVSLSSLSHEGSLMFQVAIKRENLVAEIQKRLSWVLIITWMPYAALCRKGFT